MKKNIYHVLDYLNDNKSDDNDDINDNDDDDNDNDNDNDNNHDDINDKKSISDDFINQKKDFNQKYYKYQNKYIDKFNMKIKKYNQKKILCNNYISNNYCVYKNKCLYAHDINEQNIEQNRKKILDIIKSTEDLSHLELNHPNNKYLLRELLIYTRLCENCKRKKCTGGYNCKFGACIPEHVICYDNLNYDNCKNKNCNMIHLTKKGLKPLYSKIYYTINTINTISINC